MTNKAKYRDSELPLRMTRRGGLWLRSGCVVESDFYRNTVLVEGDVVGPGAADGGVVGGA